MTKTFKIVTTVAIVILAFFFILFTGIGIGQLADSMRVYTIPEDSLLYALEDGRYGDLVDYYHRNIVSDVESTETMEECYAIARYYEAAIDYKLAVQENDTKLLEKANSAMEDAADEMGDLSYAKGEIDELLDI